MMSEEEEDRWQEMGEDQWQVLYEVREMVRQRPWVVLDTETTSLQGEVIQWAIVAPDGAVLGQGYVKPQGKITEGAREIHHISDEQVADAPTFDQVAPQIWSLLEGKAVVSYNAGFEQSTLYTSLSMVSGSYLERSEEVKQRLEWILRGCDWRCAMEWFAVIYGQTHHYYKTYTWQKLETAGWYFKLPMDPDALHDAAADARLTAQIIHKMVELAEGELPDSYHPPRNEPCAGGCGQMSSFPYTFDEDHTWYCLECGLIAGLNVLCPHCEEKGKRTIVTSSGSEKEAIPPGTMCYQCQYEVNMTSGAWHFCLRCTRIVQASEAEKPYCEGCIAAFAEECRKKQERKEELLRYRQTWYDETCTQVRAGEVTILEDQPLIGAGLVLAKNPEVLEYGYFTRADVEPILVQSEGTGPATLVLKTQGKHGKFDIPHIDHILMAASDQLVVVLVTFHTATMYYQGGGKYAITAKGQFYRYYVRREGAWEQTVWRHLSEEYRARVVEAWEAQGIAWARRPGKREKQKV